jgi:prepilin signal peptidase PulO-like enzyme (type II secretory pathway)
VELVLIILVGLLTGAVVNRLATDLPARRLPRRPRCPYCDCPRPWYHWLALPTYVVNRARCRQCAAPIRIRYPLTELALAFLFVFLYIRYGLTVRFAFFALYTVIFVLTAITDLERKLILNVVILPAIGLALVGSFLTGNVTWQSALLGGFIAFIFFLLAVWIGRALFGPGAMGEGDVTLATLIGLVVGFPLVIEALVVTVLGGGLISGLLLLTRRRSMRSFIPYGPFLVVGGWATMVWGVEIGFWFFHH